ncbi:MAG TPA: hypothetical protein VJR23_04455 [Candidatus Acidoferrales bacterium]|nr:hypothetical protein [Candidatus Acidoferrales bacterium]
MKAAFRITIAIGMALLLGGAIAAQDLSTTNVVSHPAPAPLRGAITGEPYSAHMETMHTQTLEDGTKIERKMSVTNSFRDSQGRTREEHYIALPDTVSGPDDLISVLIHDPTTGVSFLLNPKNHTARELPGLPVVNVGADTITIPQHGVPAKLNGSPRETRQHPAITTVDLGTQEMEGVIVDGTRTTIDYPAGLVGNDRPFSVVTERWQSPELKLLLLTKRTDPRSGETTTRVTNLDRSEPDPSLFQVPDGYTITKQEIVPVDQQ